MRLKIKSKVEVDPFLMRGMATFRVSKPYCDLKLHAKCGALKLSAEKEQKEEGRFTKHSTSKTQIVFPHYKNIGIQSIVKNVDSTRVYVQFYRYLGQEEEQEEAGL
tara:strand:- start:15759 stop:16076 length:318 start_codon:yes stop_codon:yes gene_type:complete